MEINAPHYVGVNWSVKRVSYNRNASLTLDDYLALLSDAELIGFIESCLCWKVELTCSCWSWNTMLLRLILKSKHVATQVHIEVETCHYWGSRVGFVDTKLLGPAFELECKATQARFLMIIVTVAFSIERDLRSPAWWSPRLSWNTTLVSVLRSAFELKCDYAFKWGPHLWLCLWWFLDSLQNFL